MLLKSSDFAMTWISYKYESHVLRDFTETSLERKQTMQAGPKHSDLESRGLICFLIDRKIQIRYK